MSTATVSAFRSTASSSSKSGVLVAAAAVAAVEVEVAAGGEIIMFILFYLYQISSYFTLLFY
jgi:hypothetical protein